MALRPSVPASAAMLKPLVSWHKARAGSVPLFIFRRASKMGELVPVTEQTMVSKARVLEGEWMGGWMDQQPRHHKGAFAYLEKQHDSPVPRGLRMLILDARHD